MAAKKTKEKAMSNSLENRNIGRRTGKDIKAGKNIRKIAGGFENFDDYWSESEADVTRECGRSHVEGSALKKGEPSGMAEQQLPVVASEERTDSVPPVLMKSQIVNIELAANAPNPFTNKGIGRRTGKDIKTGKHIRMLDGGFENFDDYWSESDGDSLASFNTTLSLQSKPTSHPPTPVKAASNATSITKKKSAISQQKSSSRAEEMSKQSVLTKPASSSTVTTEEKSDPQQKPSSSEDETNQASASAKPASSANTTEKKSSSSQQRSSNSREGESNLLYVQCKTASCTVTTGEGSHRKSGNTKAGEVSGRKKDTEKSGQDSEKTEIVTGKSGRDSENSTWKSAQDSDRASRRSGQDSKNKAGKSSQSSEKISMVSMSDSEVSEVTTAPKNQAAEPSSEDGGSEEQTAFRDTDSQDDKGISEDDTGQGDSASQSQDTEDMATPQDQDSQESGTAQEQDTHSESESVEKRNKENRQLQKQRGSDKGKDVVLRVENSVHDQSRMQSPRRKQRTGHVTELYSEKSSNNHQASNSPMKEMTGSLPKQHPSSVRKEAHSAANKQSCGSDSKVERSSAKRDPWPVVTTQGTTAEASEHSEGSQENCKQSAEINAGSSSNGERQLVSPKQTDLKSRTRGTQKDKLSTGQQGRSSQHVITAQKSVSEHSATTMSQMSGAQSPQPTSQKSSVYLSIVGDVTGSITKLVNGTVLTPEPKLYGTRRRLSYAESPNGTEEVSKAKTDTQMSRVSQAVSGGCFKKTLSSPIPEDHTESNEEAEQSLKPQTPEIVTESSSQSGDDPKTDPAQPQPQEKQKKNLPGPKEKTEKNLALPQEKSKDHASTQDSMKNQQSQKNKKKSMVSQENTKNLSPPSPQPLTSSQCVNPEKDRLHHSHGGAAKDSVTTELPPEYIRTDSGPQPAHVEPLSHLTCEESHSSSHEVGQFLTLASHTQTWLHTSASVFSSDTEDLGFEIVEESKVYRAPAGHPKSAKTVTGRSRNRVKKVSEKNLKKVSCVKMNEDESPTADGPQQVETSKASSGRKLVKRSLSYSEADVVPPTGDSSPQVKKKVRGTTSSVVENQQRTHPVDKESESETKKTTSKKKGQKISSESQELLSADTEEKRHAGTPKSRKVTGKISSRRQKNPATKRRPKKNQEESSVAVNIDKDDHNDESPPEEPQTAHKKTAIVNSSIRSKQGQKKVISSIPGEELLQEMAADMESSPFRGQRAKRKTGTTTATAVQARATEMESSTPIKSTQRANKMSAGTSTEDATPVRKQSTKRRTGTTTKDTTDLEHTAANIESSAALRSTQRAKRIKAATKEAPTMEDKAEDNESSADPRPVQKKQNTASSHTIHDEPLVPKTSTFTQSSASPISKRRTRTRSRPKNQVVVEDYPAREEQKGRRRKTTKSKSSVSDLGSDRPGKRGKKGLISSTQGSPPKKARTRRTSASEVQKEYESFLENEELKEMQTPSIQSVADLTMRDSALKSGISPKRFRLSSSLQNSHSQQLSHHHGAPYDVEGDIVSSPALELKEMQTPSIQSVADLTMRDSVLKSGISSRRFCLSSSLQKSHSQQLSHHHGAPYDVEGDIVSSPDLAPSSLAVRKSRSAHQMDTTPVRGYLSKDKRRKQRRVTISSIVEHHRFSPEDKETHEENTCLLPSMSATPVHYYQQATPTPASKPFSHRNKIVLPKDNPTGLRRSKRIRVKPIEWYKNERIIYDRRRSGPVVLGVEPSREHIYLEQENQRRRKRRQQCLMSKKQKSGSQLFKKRLSTHVALPGNLDVTTSTDIPIIHPDTKEEVLMSCLNPAARAPEIGPTGSSPCAGDPFSLRLITQQRLFTTGTITLAPEAEKPLQRAMNTALLYFITYGKVLVTISRATAVLETGDHFFVPRGTVYSLRNLRREEACLTFANLMIDQADSPIT